MSYLRATRGVASPEYPERQKHQVTHYDQYSIIVNGRPARPYLPSDPGRRRRLLQALGAIPPDPVPEYLDAT